MKKSLCANLSHAETVWGWVYLVFQTVFLPSLLTAGNAMFSPGLNKAELNFVYFLLNFLAIVFIFHDFLGDSFRQVLRHPAYFCQAVILGAVAYFACSRAMEWVTALLVPKFANANDASISVLYRNNPFLMTVGTVILVPPVEECLYRGLIFRKLYGKNRWAAYLTSIFAFALIHILGFLGVYSPLELCMAVLQYLPAGLCLAWAYTKADTIFAPIVIHAIVNAVGIYRMR